MSLLNDFNNIDLTFIIPVRHQENSKDWSRLKENLSHTMRSIAGQRRENWRAIIVANEGADLPPLLPRFQVERVQFPPNMLHEQGGHTVDDFRDAFRVDKGRRVLAGMVRAKGSRYFMIVDDDDFISRDISQFVADNIGQNGWFVKEGYVWRARGHLTYLHNDFSHFCGTSLIIRSDLYELSERLEDYSEETVKKMLGSHVFIADYLQEQGCPLEPLPFPGAVYQVGHAGAHSRSSGLLRTFLFNKSSLKSPRAAMRSLSRFRSMDAVKRRQFMLPAD